MDAITLASISMQDDLQRLNTISQNLANVATLGYKRQVVMGRSFASFLPQASTVDQTRVVAESAYGLDMRPGSLRVTGNPLDLAVEGEGFFEVVTDQGRAYARQGTVRLDARGHLVTQQGVPLAGLHGDARTNGGTLSFGAQGEVTQGERSLGQIKLVRFDKPELMQALGHGLFAQGGAVVSDANPGALRSGFQEASNVNSAQEMVRLTETVRHFETMQKVMQGYGEVFEQTLRKLGEF